MNRFIIAVVVLLLGGVMGASVQAQQDAQYTQFMFNKLYFNPAYAGSKKFLCLNGLYRKQWIGIDRAPQSATLQGHGAVWKKRIGLGVSIDYDQIGFTDNINLATNYSYIIRFRRGDFLSLGLRASLSYLQIRWGEANPSQGNDQAIPSSGLNSTLMPNFGAGVYYESKHWYAGLSVPHLFENQLEFTIQNNGGVTPRLRQHYYLMGGLNYKLAQDVDIQPNILFKYVDNAPLDVDINVSFVFLERFLAGVTYRVGDSIDLMVRWQIAPQFQIAFAYDITLSPLQQYNAGTVETMLQYCFLPKHEKVNNPRFF